MGIILAPFKAIGKLLVTFLLVFALWLVCLYFLSDQTEEALAQLDPVMEYITDNIPLSDNDDLAARLINTSTLFAIALTLIVRMFLVELVCFIFPRIFGFKK